MSNNNPLEQLFQMFSQAAMKPKKYFPISLPQTVTVTLEPETMELLHLISCRIGTTRAVVASNILKIGAVEAATGCGFSVDEEGKVSDEGKNWDTKPKTMGFSFAVTDEEK